MEGWLNKKGGGLSFGFSKKYFRLENFTLYFTSGPTDRSTKESFDLRTCTLLADGALSPGEKEAELEFQLHVQKKKIQLRAPTAEEKRCWLNVLEPFNNIASASASGNFVGIPIAGVMANGLFACIEALSRDGCVQGIFRESGKVEDVKNIYMAFIRGGRSIPPSSDVHAVAGCLKKLLREMPETLFTNRLFEQVIAPNPTPARIAAFVSSLPSLNKQILTALIELLYLIVCDGRTTRMDVKNLSIVFTPNLTRKDQPGVVLPIESFWQILIMNKDSVLYGGGAPPRPSPPPAAAAASKSLTASSSSSSSPPAPGIPARPTAINTKHALAASSSSASQSQQQQQQQSSPNSEPGLSPVNYAQPVKASAPIASIPSSDDNNSMLQSEEDLDSLFPNDPSTLDLSEKPVAAPPRKEIAAPVPPVVTTKPAVRAPGAYRPASDDEGGDDDDDDGPGNMKVGRPGGMRMNLKPGMMAAGGKKPAAADDDDEMDLFEESNDDIMDQAKKNAEAIKKARESRAAAANTTTNKPASPKRAPQAAASAAAVAAKKEKDALKDSFGFDDSMDGTESDPRSPAAAAPGIKKNAAARVDDTDGTLDLSLAGGNDNTLSFDSPSPKKREVVKPTVAAAAAAAPKQAVTQPSAKAATSTASAAAVPSKPKAGAPADDSLLNSSFDNDDFTLGSQLPDEPAAKLAAAKSVANNKEKEDLGVSHIAHNDTLADEDGSLLSLASDLSFAAPDKPAAKPAAAKPAVAAATKPAAAPPQKTAAAVAAPAAASNDPESSLTFGDDTDFDLSADASIKERVYSSKPGAKPAAATARPSTPPRKPTSQQAPLSAVKEAPAIGDDDEEEAAKGLDDSSAGLSLSLDDSFSSDAGGESNEKKRKAALIKAAAAKARAKNQVILPDSPVAKAPVKTIAKPAAAPAPAAAAAPPVAKKVEQQKVNIPQDDSTNFSLDLDSQLASPPKPAPAVKLAEAKKPAAAAAAPAKPAPAASAKAAPKQAQQQEEEDNSLDLLSAAGDQSLNLLSGFDDESELPPPSKPAKPAATAAAAAVPPVAASKAAAASAPTPVPAPATASKSAVAKPATTKPALTVAPEVVTGDKAASSFDDPSTLPSPAVTPALSPQVVVVSRAEDSAEINRLLREVRRLELESHSLQKALADERALGLATRARAEDAERQVAALRSAASSEVQDVIRRAEQDAAAQRSRNSKRFHESMAMLARRAEDAEARSLELLKQKDNAEQRSADAAEKLEEARVKATQSDSALRSSQAEILTFQQLLSDRDTRLTQARKESITAQEKLTEASRNATFQLENERSGREKAESALAAKEQALKLAIAEREEEILQRGVLERRVAQLQSDLEESRSGSTSYAGGLSLGSAVALKAERDRERQQFERDRAAWTESKTNMETKVDEVQEKFKSLLQTHTNLESEYRALLSKLEREELQRLSHSQKISYLSQALACIEAESSRRLRIGLSALANRCLINENLEQRVAILESNFERVASEDIFRNVLEQQENLKAQLAKEQAALNDETAQNSMPDKESPTTASSASGIAAVLDRYPALQSLVPFLKPNDGEKVFRPVAFQSSSSTSAAASSNPSPLSTERSGYRSASQPSLPSTSAIFGPTSGYRSSLEFIPLVTPAPRQSYEPQVFARAEEEKQTGHEQYNQTNNGHNSGGDLTDRSVRSNGTNGTSSTYKPFSPAVSSYASQRMFTSTSGGLMSPVSKDWKPFSPFGTASSPTSTALVRPSMSLEDSTRQLMAIEAKTRAGLDASHQRLQSIEQSLAAAQLHAHQHLQKVAFDEQSLMIVRRSRS